MEREIVSAGRRSSLIAVVLLAVALPGLGGCDKWFGKEPGPPLPGNRISVLLHSRSLVPDPQVAGAEILLPEPSPNADWPQAGGYANHAMHHIEVAEDIERVWNKGAGSGASTEERLVSEPVIADGRVYVMDTASRVHALDAANGKTLWKRDLTPDEEEEGYIGGGVAYDNGRLFAATGYAELAALDAGNGAVLWRRTVDGPVHTPPTVRGGRVFVVTVENKLHAMAADDGRPLWDHAGITESASLLGGAAPAVDSGVVVVAYSSGELVALSVENGNQLWSESLTSVRRTDAVSTLSHIRGRPVIDRGMVFAISHGGFMAAVDLRSGRRVWDREIGGSQSPWVAGDYLFVLTNDAELACLGRRDGRVHWVLALRRWEDEEDNEGPIVWTGPILASDRLIVTGSHGEAVAVSPYSGEILGAVEMPDAVSVPPVVADGTVFFLTDDADLVAYR